jgi:hypothetical protein
MLRGRMPFFAAFALAAAGISAAADGDYPRFVVPHVPDLTIRTRETIDLPESTVRTNTLYFRGAWQRTELQFSSSLSGQRTVRNTIKTVDTGERRQVGSSSARHLITTITTDPSPGASTRPSESVADGWHIDLPPTGCWDAGDGHSFFTASVVRADGPQPNAG